MVDLERTVGADKEQKAACMVDSSVIKRLDAVANALKGEGAKRAIRTEALRVVIDRGLTVLEEELGLLAKPKTERRVRTVKKAAH